MLKNKIMRKYIILRFFSLLFFLCFFSSYVFAAMPIIHSITPNIALSNSVTDITIQGKNFEVNPRVIISDGSLRIRGNFNTPDSASNVGILGNYAYVADSESGLQIIDIAVPSNPVLVGKYNAGSYVYDVTISGKYAYIASGNGLHIIDIGTMPTPSLIKEYKPSTFWSIKNIVIHKNFAYVSSGLGGNLYIIDISNPNEPIAVGEYDSYGSIQGIAIAGNYAYLANSYNGLQIIDISDPSSPVWVGEYDNSSSAKGLLVVGQYAYVVYSSRGLQILDISNPSKPILIGGYNGTSAYDIRISGIYAYIANYNGLLVIDISDPTNPSKVGACDTPGSAKALAISGDFAYIADGTSGLQVIENINYPADPFFVGEYDTPNNAEAVEISGNYAYVADNESGLQIFNISNPAKPLLTGKVNTPGNAKDVKLSGDYAYVADSSGGLQVIDVSNKSEPLRVGVYNTSAKGSAVYASSLVVSDNYAYVTCGGGYINDFDGLQIVDISNPTNPSWIGEYDTKASAYDVAISGKYAYVTSSYKGLKIIDISNPANLSLVGEYDTSGSAKSISIVGKYAYIGYSYSSGLQVVDISNPANPAWVGEILLDSIDDFAIFGDFVYIIGKYDSYKSDLLVVDISVPLDPLLVTEYNIPGWFSGSSITISGKYVYIAAESDGLQIFNPVYKATSINFVDSETITCQIPYGLKERFYNITVVNPINGEKEILANAFEAKNTLKPDYTDADGDGFYLEIDDCVDTNFDINANTAWYQDLDGDNYGNPSVFLTQCLQPESYALDNTDCNDSDSIINPETVWYKDVDNDGYSEGTTLIQCQRPSGYRLKLELTDTKSDCDDNNSILNPNTVWYQDLDGDNYGDPSVFLTQCLQPESYALDNTDPNDNNSSITGEADKVPTLSEWGMILLVIMVLTRFYKIKDVPSLS